MSYLLDTNVLSEWRKTVPNPGVAEWFERSKLDEIFISVITIGEIRRGISKLQLRNEYHQAATYEAWLMGIKNLFANRLIPVSVEAAEEWGRNDSGHAIAVTDGLIAATAKVHGWTVVTRNVKDFDAIGVRLLNPFTD